MAKVTSMNDEQIQAVEARNSHILVSAPAGSGKTKILVSRILSILKENGYKIAEFKKYICLLLCPMQKCKKPIRRLRH